MSRREALFPALLIVVVAALLIGGWIAGYTWTAMAFPFASGAAVIVLSAAELAAILARPPAEARRADDDTPELSLASMLWMFALAPFLYGLGFVAGPAAYLLIYLRAAQMSWAFALTTAAVSVAVTWGLFIKVMGVLLPLWPLWLA